MKKWITQLSRETIRQYTAGGYWETRRTLNDYFCDALAKHPSQEMIVDRDRRVTYRQMDVLLNELSSGLQKLGVEKGDVVSFQLPNWMESLAIYLACKRIGAVSNPIIAIYRSTEVGFILKQAESKVMIIPDRFRNFDYSGMLTDLWPSLPNLEHVVVVEEKAPDGMMIFDDLLKLGRNTLDEYTAVRVDPNEVSLLLYTSGTTSEPKGVIHTHNTILWEAKSARDLLKLGDDLVVLMSTPITHIGGLFAGMELPTLVGGKVVFQDIWEPEQALELIQRERCNFMTGSTPFLQGIVTHPKVKEFNLKSLKSFGCGGAPVPPGLIYQAINELGINSGRGYGLTEFSTITLYKMDDPVDKLAHTDGSQAPGVEIRIVNPITGKNLGTGEEGEILARGPECFVGYKDPSLNEGAFEGDWFHTGDLGVMDMDGYFTVTGRKKDIIIRSGENISVKEVEDMVHAHPKVEEVAIVGMPDPVTGEKACAYVTLAEGMRSLTLEELKDFLIEQNLAKQKMPERIEIIDKFPRTHSGKIKKNVLKADIVRKLAS